LVGGLKEKCCWWSVLLRGWTHFRPLLTTRRENTPHTTVCQ